MPPSSSPSDASVPARCAVGSPPPGTVALDSGLLRGARAGDTFAYRGVPYAAPPVGDLRGHAPRPAACFAGVRDATAFTRGCVQVSPAGHALGGDDDCLYANVWTPASPAALLPVVLFLHGGFFLEGTATDKAYDGERLADALHAVVVTVDYRLGAAGFSAHDPETNLGLRDAIAALEWLRTNARAFGGDPDRVTLFGEEAGGTAALALLASPRARGLFAHAIVAGASTSVRSRADAEANPGTGPWVDGDIVPEALDTLFARGAFAHVPLVLGSNADDAATFISMRYTGLPVDDELTFRKVVHATLDPVYTPAKVDFLLAHYPYVDYPSARRLLVGLETDRSMTCPTRRLLRALSPSLPNALFRYVYAHTDSSGLDRQYGAGATLERKFVWRTLTAPGFTATARETAMSDALGGYFARFVASGDPNDSTKSAPAWPAYVAASDPYLVVDETSSPSAGMHSTQCDVWDSLRGPPSP
jgi:para-nitrobenzyl esterase